MSVQLVAWALETPCGSISRKAVLIALANAANHHTGLCCPSLKRLAKETDSSVKTVQRCLDDLEAMGLIQRQERQRDNGSQTSNAYRFFTVTVTTPPGQNDHPPLVTVTTPEPEVRTGSEPSMPSARKRNEIWDALTVMFGEATTRSAQTKRGKVTKELRDAGATYDEILARGKRWPMHFDTATLTETALVNHWDRLGRKPLRAGGR